jgi:hypothetical protein
VRACVCEMWRYSVYWGKGDHHRGIHNCPFSFFLLL